MYRGGAGGFYQGLDRWAVKSRNLSLRWGTLACAAVVLSPLAPCLVSRLWACPWKTLTGISGPFCGTARAALALARLDLVEAFGHYPLPALGLTVFVVGGLVVGCLALWDRAPRLTGRWPGWAQPGLVLAVLANWVYNVLTGV